MEARRLAVLRSHLHPAASGSTSIRSPSLSASSCNSVTDGGSDSLQGDCVFCRIIQGESPAFKIMEARRLAVLRSHLHPAASGSTSIRSPSLSASSCNSVTDGGSDSLQGDCVFCRIIQGESPAFKLYEDERCLCILDTRPLTHGHSLIIPKSHFSSLEATPPSVIAAMCSKVPFISNAIMKATGSDSFNLLVNCGAAAGQVIFHTHIHIIPRKAHDCLWASETFRRHSLTLDEEASRLVDCVREQLNVAESGEDQESNHAGNE